MITPSSSITTTERTLPKLALNFTSASLDPLVTFSRSGNTATVINSSGQIVSVNADVPRFEHTVSTGGACKGLLIEEARTNVIANSILESALGVYPDNWGLLLVTGTSSIQASTITNTGFSCTQSVGGSSARIVFQPSFVVSANTTYTFSVNIEATSGNVASFAYFSASPAGSTVTEISNPSTPGRYSCRIVVGATAGTATMRIGVGTKVGTTNRSITWSCPQFEEGAFDTSYIPTANTPSATSTRNADIATVTGTNFSDLWQSSKGSVLAILQQNTVVGTRPIIQFDDNSADNIIALRGNTTNPELYIKNTTDQAQIDAGTIAANTAYRLAGSWSTNNCAASINSGTPVLDGVASIPVANQARIGSDGTNYLNGSIQSIEYYAERLLSSNLQVISSSSGYRSIIFPVVRDTIIS